MKEIFKKHKSKIILLAVILISVLIYLFVPQVNLKINESVKILTTAGLPGIIDYIRSYGVYAAVVSFLLMILQSIVSPIPAFFITLSNAAIFGWVKGAILSWTSSMVGAVMCFYIARILGRDTVEKITGRGSVKKADDFLKKYGKHAILVARLLPFVSFDVISYVAGLTSVSLGQFVIATGLGQLPATIIYSYVGGELTGGAQKLVIGLLTLFAFTIVLYIGRKIYIERKKSKDN